MYRRKSRNIDSPKKDEFEVGGVSRSGRVRKKSSKLLDYDESAEDERSKKRTDLSSTRTNLYGEGPSYQQDYQYDLSGGHRMLADDLGLTDESSYPELELDVFQQPKNVQDTYGGASTSNAFSVFSGGGMEDDILDDGSDVKLPRELQPRESLSSRPVAGCSQTSLYMMETAKPGRKPKAGRKDKGKARFSAYMLWAKQIRPLVMKTNLNIDFSQLSSRLSELWATVPYTEKEMWRKKAKRLAMTAQSANEEEERIASKTQTHQFLKPVSGRGGRGRGRGRGRPGRPRIHPLPTPQPASVSFEDRFDLKSITNPETLTIGTKPIDVAAYFKLLGEALAVIGKRLTNHEGRIAVSGSLSVLLDALLCALGALLCLTQEVLELKCIPVQTLSNIMNNITIIMPGVYSNH